MVGLKQTMLIDLYQLREGIIVRLEYFGGMIIDIVNNAYYQIPKYDALVLFCLKYENNINVIINEILTKLDIKKETFDCNLYEKENFIVKISQKNNIHRDNLNLYLYIKDILNNIENINHLSAPLNISIYPSFSCQANCNFCYVKNYCKDDHRIMQFHVLKKLIDDIERLQIPYVSILGGEPLLLPYIEELLDYMSKKRIIFNITTNGWLLNEKVMYYIKKFKNINLSISLQSIDNYHTLATKLNYKEIINNIKNTRGNCRINTVYINQTFEQLEKLVDFVYNEGIKTFTLALYNNVKLNPKEQNNNHIKFLNAKQHLNKYIKSKHYDIDFRAEGCLQYLFEQKVKIIPKTDIEKIFTKCEAGNLKLEIMPNGDTIGCMALDNNFFKSGNIFDNKLEDIWNHDEKLNLLRNSLCKVSECKNCKYYSFCNGGCTAQRFLTNKNFEKVKDGRCLKIA